MTSITFRDALSVLSKSSPFSVKTVSDRIPDGYDELKNRLYIRQDIEDDLLQRLTDAQPGDMLFLCGSSGDGKSEILTRAYQQYRDVPSITFHLDATHSFQPHQSALEALDQVFTKATSEHKILVVGINIGMIGNYVQGGSDEHSAIKQAMDAFLNHEKPASSYAFFSFEDYPKFTFDEQGRPVAPFAKRIMQRLTEQVSENPFYAIFTQTDVVTSDPRLATNYRLLMLDSVQDAIVTNIVKARLIRDQFITARGLLDLLHQVLTGPGYLFDNLFAGGDNEIGARFAAFDPALLRTRHLDQLHLRYGLGLPEDERDAFLAALQPMHIAAPGDDPLSSNSLVRLLYLVKGEAFGQGYAQQYADEFADRLLTDYAAVWRMHARFDDSPEARSDIRKFYVINTLNPSIFHYANRNAPELESGEILLGEFNGVKVAGAADIKPDYASLKVLAGSNNIAQFQVALKVGSVTLKPIDININLFNLLIKLNQGYRPNKHDKNTVVLLDELVEQIKAVVKCSDRVKFYSAGKSISLRYEDDMIDAAGEM